HLGEALVVLELLARTLREQAEDDAYGQPAVLPDLEQGQVARRGEIEAAGIADAGEPEPVELAEELRGAGDAVVEARQGQRIEQRWEGGIAPGDPAGRISLGVALDLAARRHVGVVRNAERLETRGGQQHCRVERLDVDGMVRRNGHELRLSRSAPFLELL